MEGKMLIKELEKFLDDATCDIILSHLKAKIDFKDIKDIKSTPIPENDHDLLASIKDKISSIIKIPRQNFEELIVTCVPEGYKTEPHLDCFFIKPNTEFDVDSYHKNLETGGQRAYTCMIYLNDNYKGGDTFFDRIYVTINPLKGKLAYWNNLKEDGDINVNSEHMDMLVTSGFKWVLSCFIREKRFTGTTPRNL